MMNGNRRRLRALAVTLMVGAGMTTTMLTASPGAARTRYTTTSIKIADGLTLLKVKDSRGPNRIRVLRIDPAKAVTIDVGLAGKVWPAYAPTSSIASAYGAIGAVNADFNGGAGRPLHAFLEDGTVATSGVSRRWIYGISDDETVNHMGYPRVRTDALDETRNRSKPVAAWNAGSPDTDELAAYTSQGGTVERPPKDACYARLDADSAPLWTTDHVAIEREYVVAEHPCQHDALLPTDAKEVILASGSQTSTKAQWLKALAVGGKVRLTWEVTGWPDMLDIQGGMPLLVENGNVVAPAHCGSSFCDRNPRTGVGYNSKTNRVYYITVDGRMSTSVGMTLPEFARQFTRYGCDWALNFDGGGSTTMVAKIPGSGLQVVNKPSGGNERPVPSVMLVLPGSDAGEPKSLSGGSAMLAGLAGMAPATVPCACDPEAALRAAIQDPGSTGGLMAALASGGLGFRGTLPPALRAIAERYVAARELSGQPA